MSRLSPTVPKRLLADRRPPAEVLPDGDTRVEVLSLAVVPYERREDYAREITSLWNRAQAAFLVIGRYLTLAKQRLPHGEFEAMVEQDLPFGPRAAHQIRTAAQAVDSGRLPAESLPPNYSTIYQLASLPDAALEEARREGLIRPDVRRAEVLAFRKRLIAEERAPEENDLARRLDALRRQRQALDEEIARLEAEMGRDEESDLPA